MRIALMAATAALIASGAQAATPEELKALSQAATSAAIVQALAPPPKAPPGPTSITQWIGTPVSAPVAPSVAQADTPAASAPISASGSSASVVEQRQPVATAYAPPAAFSVGTCYVSGGIGLQGVTFGGSLSVPKQDKGCEARATAQALAALGAQDAALEYLRENVPGVAKALDATKK